jgi:hypothetical protein
MSLENYRDLSTSGNDVSAGFQFEFFCSNCSRKWRSPFKPYRMGQITGLLTRFAFLFGDVRTAGRATGNVADMGSRGARAQALQEVMPQAERLYTVCKVCHEAACADCFSTRDETCHACLEKAGANAREHEMQARAEAREASAHACPNCRSEHAGGRFCAECGFDMASTHKSCPGCGAMTARSSRFCTDCGHSF